MAIDMCSENSSPGISPRISFSHDLRHTHADDVVPIEHYQCRPDPDPDSDFNFCISVSTESEPSSADELFSDGLIRPRQIQQRFVSSKQQISISKPHSVFSLPPLPLPSSTNESSKQEKLKETMSFENDPKYQSKSFWRIKRSSSLHCDNTSKKSSIWSLPLLLRSNSTGSVPNSKRTLSTSSSKNSKKQPKPSSSSSSSFYVYPLSQKPPLKRNYGGYYDNGFVQMVGLDKQITFMISGMH
ncbi:hypothetical protein F0562_025141 [Nyssa sinensis]|uniref:Uncharacterized protein n=1 Tax=Nyssa sinensis TaxID=561372 RepID=A0A5J5BHM8_9ASTE|nr:hypothetical protein F0562_025141 [Nyssa sinensis]